MKKDINEEISSGIMDTSLFNNISEIDMSTTPT